MSPGDGQKTGSDPVSLLRDSEARLKAIVDHAVDGIVTTDAGGVIELFNRAAERMFGYAAPEVIGRNVTILMPEPHRENHDRHIRSYLETGQAKVIGIGREVVGRRKDGSAFPMDLSLTEIRLDDRPFFVGLLRDITGRKKAVEALRESEAFKNQILESSPDCIKVLDLEGRLLFMSKGGMARLEISDSASPLNCQWIEFWKDEDRQNARAAIETARAGGVGRFQGFSPTSTGKPKWWDVLITPMRGLTGKPERLLAISRDITESKQVEEALCTSGHHLRALLEDRDRIALGLHDNVIQTIYAVGLNLEECRNLTEENPRQARWELERAITDLNAVIRDLRSYITGGEPQVSAGPGLREAIGRLAATMVGAHQVRFSLKLDPGAADRLTAGQAGPVLSIAHEAMSNTLRHAHAQECIVSLQLRGGGVRLLVEDDGVGFVPGASAGQGLGLHNLAERAQRLGAKLEIISGPGRGTHIVLDIPT